MHLSPDAGVPMTRPAYLKRYRMERELARPLPLPAVPAGVHLVPWTEHLLHAHARVKHDAFRDEPDALLFPSFLHLGGCVGLMRAIRDRAGFCPSATWLAVGPDGPCGTVQGLTDETGAGAIQNLGVLPTVRGFGVGELLLLKALHGFRAAGCRRASLEVTAQNAAAVTLYRKHGFRCVRTLYKPTAADPDPVAAGI